MQDKQKDKAGRPDTDAALARLVYDLYYLTAEEIAIVEGQK